MTMFQRQFGRRAWAGLVAAGALVIVAGIAVRAEQGQGGGGRGGMVPMTASTIARNPAAHMGAIVSMMASVEAQLSKTVFTVDQDKTKTGQEILIIAPTLQTPPQANAYVTVQGEVFTFDPAEVAKKARNYTLDLSPELIAKYQGKPAVLATAVVNAALVDLAKRVLPPMTPAELAFRQNMLTIDAGAKALVAGLDQPNAAQLKDTIAGMKKAYTDVEAFFKGREHGRRHQVGGRFAQDRDGHGSRPRRRQTRGRQGRHHQRARDLRPVPRRAPRAPGRRHVPD